MKFFMPGDRKSALCHRDGRVALSKTDLVKALVLKIYGDIVQPDHPKHQKELSQIADVVFA